MATPPQEHLFVDNNVKEEPQTVYGGGKLINRFDVICRFCLNENECMLDIFGSNDCIVEMTEALVDVKMDVDDMLPRQICTNCYNLLNQCSAFKQQVALSDTALRLCIHQVKQVDIKSQTQRDEVSQPEITEHIFDTTSTTNELTAGYKFENLMNEKCIPDDKIVCKQEPTLYSAYEEIPIETADDAIDYMTEVKAEPTSNNSNVIESQDKFQTSVKSKSTLEKHFRSQAVKKLQYQCDVPSESISQQDRLNGHLSSQQRPNGGAKEQANVFKCTKCNANFSVEQDLYIHGSIHPDDNRIRCRQCGKNFSNLTKLRCHIKNHYESKRIKCKECGRSFTRKESLMRHYWIHLKEPSDKRHVCKDCGKSFFDLYDLSVHYRKHTGEKPYKCPHCSKNLTTSLGLLAHVRVCSDETPYKCSYCLKPFGMASTLVMHLRTHTGEKPFVCPHCSKSFGRSSSLVSHVRTHTGEKPYKCSMCPKSFGRADTLTKHVRTHTGEKPYKCSHCPQSFSSSSTLAIHTRKHTGEKPLKCSHCPKKYRSSSALSKHVRTHINSAIQPVL